MPLEKVAGPPLEEVLAMVLLEETGTHAPFFEKEVEVQAPLDEVVQLTPLEEIKTLTLLWRKSRQGAGRDSSFVEEEDNHCGRGGEDHSQTDSAQNVEACTRGNRKQQHKAEGEHSHKNTVPP